MRDSESPYRWVIVGTSAIMLAFGVGLIANGLSVFIKPLNTEFGWQRGSVSLIYFAGVMGMALGGIVMGRVADRTATRRVSLFGAIVLGLCLLAAARADALWQVSLGRGPSSLRLSRMWAIGSREMWVWRWELLPPARRWGREACLMAPRF